MRFASFFNARGRALALASLMLVATAAVPLSASAHPANSLNFRWSFSNWSQYLLNLYYQRDCVPDWGNADASANAWTGTATPLDYHYVGGCNGSVEYNRVKILNGSQSGGLAWTETYHQSCFLWWCWFDFNWAANSSIDAVRIYENHYSSAYDNLSTNQRRDVLKHELGHAIGLRHAGYYGGETPDSRGYPYSVYSIMDYCCPSDYTGWPYYVPTTPTTHDVNEHWVWTSSHWFFAGGGGDVNQIYPSNYWPQ
jgi:hypothetical protein